MHTSGGKRLTYLPTVLVVELHRNGCLGHPSLPKDPLQVLSRRNPQRRVDKYLKDITNHIHHWIHRFRGPPLTSNLRTHSNVKWPERLLQLTERRNGSRCLNSWLRPQVPRIQARSHHHQQRVCSLQARHLFLAQACRMVCPRSRKMGRLRLRLTRTMLSVPYQAR
jgi:hypothetical protein